MNRLLFAMLCLVASLSLMAAEGFSSLEEQMSGKEFTASGLDKLSQAELEALNNWIRRHSVATLDSPRAGTASAGTSAPAQDRRGLKSENDEDRSEITSRIVGNFSGWDGQTVFKLENGMIWLQADKDKFYTKDMENPVVIIKPGMFGTWRLKIEGFGSECKVKRIQ